MSRGEAVTLTTAEAPAPVSTPGRQACSKKGCFASFEASTAQPGEVRHCNRGGPDGGHPHRWDLTSWQVQAGTAMEHDRS